MIIAWQPNPGPQTAFLSSTAREVLFGGAVGGGKTAALIAMPLRWAHRPEHRAIIFRRERRNAQEMIDRMRELYEKVVPGIQWHETELRFKLPAGGFIYVAYAELEKDIEKWKSFEFNLILFDELTEFTEYQYTFMLTRNRSKAVDLPLQIRSATNPGGEGMAWVMRRFIDGKEPYKVYTYVTEVEGYDEPLTITRQFIPSTIFDNPKLPNRDAYIAGLANLDEVTREAMLYGRWDRFRGQYFPKVPEEVDPGFRYYLGDWYVIRCMDYGWGDPTCILWLIVYPNKPRIEVAAEVYGSQMTIDSITQLVQSVERDLNLKPENIRYSVLSPEAFHQGREGMQSVASLLAERGVWFQRANSHRVSGWARIAQLIDRDELVVWRGRAPNLMRTLPRLPRDPNNPNDIRKRGVEDHAAEALRYGCMAYYNPPEDVPEEARQAAELSPEQLLASNRDPYWGRLRSRSRSSYIEGLGIW